jgi:hypothetical protein
VSIRRKSHQAGSGCGDDNRLNGLIILLVWRGVGVVKTPFQIHFCWFLRPPREFLRSHEGAGKTVRLLLADAKFAKVPLTVLSFEGRANTYSDEEKFYADIFYVFIDLCGWLDIRI